jgi:serine protease Do
VSPVDRAVRLLLIVGLVGASIGCDSVKGLSGGAPSSSATASPDLPPGAVDVPPTAASVSPPKVHAPPSNMTAVSGLPSFADLVAKAKPAVVTVRAWVKKHNAFGREIAEAQGVGTGFVYDQSGYLLTNNHVIEGAHEVVVTFADDRELDAKVVGADQPTDVAVLKVEEEGLAALPLGDSTKLRVGDWVVAIGNPFGLDYSVSAGILSAKGRTRDDVQGLDPSGYFNFLQTDASINPGNSGGPLINLAGQVVGINAAVRANANGIGFAIPMDMVVKLLPMLLKEGKIRRSAIGIMVDDISRGDAQRLERARVGAKVTRVFPGKAGDQAGLAVGDIIVEFDGKAVNDKDHLRWLASIAGVNRTVGMRVIRGERTFEMRITLGKLESP